MAFVAVDCDSTEWVYEVEPTRHSDYWRCEDDSASMLELPKGSICKLIGRDLTWEDGFVELRGEYLINKREFS